MHLINYTNVFILYGFLFNLLDNIDKGIIYGIVRTALSGFQPIIANSRPSVLDAHLFVSITCIIEVFIFLSLVLREIYNPFWEKNANF